MELKQLGSDRGHITGGEERKKGSMLNRQAAFASAILTGGFLAGMHLLMYNVTTNLTAASAP